MPAADRGRSALPGRRSTDDRVRSTESRTCCLLTQPPTANPQPLARSARAGRDQRPCWSAFGMRSGTSSLRETKPDPMPAPGSLGWLKD